MVLRKTLHHRTKSRTSPLAAGRTQSRRKGIISLSFVNALAHGSLEERATGGEPRFFELSTGGTDAPTKAFPGDADAIDTRHLCDTSTA